MQITDAQLAKILRDMVILIDTREQKCQHIKDYLDREGIPYEVRKLETADYTFYLPHYPELELDESVIVERKNSLDEIAQNFSKGRARFKREFERVVDEDMHVVIEKATFAKLFKGSYRSQLPPKSLFGSIMSWSIKYNVQFWFANQTESPEVIHGILKYGLRDKLLKLSDRG